MASAPKVLIVEDERDSALLLESILKDYGYKVIGKSETGEEAVKIAAELKPDLVLMDITLKGNMDGIDTAYTMSQKYGTPFIYITGGTDNETFNRAKETMPLGYILKPYDRNIIKSCIEMGLYRNEIEKKLKESEKRNSEILSYIPDIMFRLDSNGNFIDKKEKEIAKNIWPSKVSEKAMPVIKKAFETGDQQFYDYLLKKKEKERYHEARIIRASDDHILVVVRDISDRKIAEIELNQYKENLEQIVDERMEELGVATENMKMFKHAIDQSMNSIVIINNYGKIEYANNRFVKLSGYTKDELIGIDVGDGANPVLPEPEIWKLMSSLGHWKGEIYNLSKSGKIFYGDAEVISINNEDGRISHYILQFEDITRRKMEEKEIETVREALDKTDIQTVDMEMDWQEWREKILSRNISRTDKSLFRNINNSFTQGAGLGSLISLLDMMSSSAEKENDKYKVDCSLFDLIINNVNISQDAFKMFTNLDWIISNDFELENMTVSEIHDFVKVVISKANEFIQIKRQKILISDSETLKRNLILSINKEYLYKAVYEILINAMKFSKFDTYIIILFRADDKNLNISFTNDPDKGENDTLGIPAEYEKVVFEPFYRLSKLVFEQYRSLDFGLGLTLIEKIISKHGGEIHLGNITDHSDIKRDPQQKVNLTISLPIKKA